VAIASSYLVLRLAMSFDVDRQSLHRYKNFVASRGI
jgi:hypothetical protein